MNAIQELDDRCVVVVSYAQFSRARRVGLAAADALHAPLRRRPWPVRTLRRTDQVVRQVLLADGPEVADEPVEQPRRPAPRGT